MYAQLLGLKTPWSVEDVKLDMLGKRVEVVLVSDDGKLTCPECGMECGRYDSRERRWMTCLRNFGPVEA